MSNELDINNPTGDPFYRFDSILGLYLDIFASNSLTEETRKEGFMELSQLHCLINLFVFLKNRANSEAFDDMLFGVTEPLSMMLKLAWDTYQGNNDIDFLIMRLKIATDNASDKFSIDSEPVIELLDKQHYLEMKSKARQTITRTKKTQGFGSATTQGGVN